MYGNRDAPCHTMAFCKILSLQYSWLLDGCDLSFTFLWNRIISHRRVFTILRFICVFVYLFFFYPLIVTVNAALIAGVVAGQHSTICVFSTFCL